MPDTRYQIPDTACQVPKGPAEAEEELKHDLEVVEGDDGNLALHEGSRPLGYRDLRVWQAARALSIEVHRMTLEKLPRFEMHEEAAQIRRSAKSVRSNIVEGFGRRRYRLEFIKFLVYAEASCDETTDHLETLHETGSLTDSDLYEALHTRSGSLGRSLNRFRSAVEEKHESQK
jgi:four helix bundle protein